MFHQGAFAGLTITMAVFMASGGPVRGPGVNSPQANRPSLSKPTLNQDAVAPVVEAAETVRATPAQRASAAAAFAWHARDAGLLNAEHHIPQQFVDRPNLQVRNGTMAAKVRDRAEMIRLASVEVAAAADAAPAGTARRAVEVQGFGAIRQRAEERMSEARSRLEPSLITPYMDVDVHIFRVPAGWTEEQTAALLMATGDYEYVEPDWTVYPVATTPNDPSFGQQWHHRAQNMNSVGAWDYVTGGPDIIVAICDTGVRKSHADLTTFVPGFDAVFRVPEAEGGVIDDGNGHGTSVAGAAAARGNNGIGVAGVGWNFSIMPVRVSNSPDGTASISDILVGARWAALNGAFVANCSYGGGNSSQSNTTGQFLRDLDALLVFATGNDGIQDQNSNPPYVIMVGASTQSNTVAGFSNYGVGVDVVAPGVSIRTTSRGGGYTTTQGTSLSAPLAAGSLALIRAANPSLSADQIEQILFDTALDISPTGPDIFSGFGMVNVGAAVLAALDGVSLINLPFADDFATGELSNLWQDMVGQVEVVDNVPGSSLNAMRLTAQDSITTVGFRAVELVDDVLQVRFDYQRQGVETGKALQVEYLDFQDVWRTLATLTSDGDDTDGFRTVRFGVPQIGRYDGVRVRFNAQGADETDEWFITNVLVDEFLGNEFPWQTGFENGVDTSFDWSSADAVATTEAQNTPEGSFSAKLTGNGVMVSQPIDFSTAESFPYLRLRTQHVGVDAGNTLTVEYLDNTGTWRNPITVTSDGQDQTGFQLHQVLLPANSFSTDFVLRITSNATTSSQTWYIDDVAIAVEPVVDEPDCPVDIDGDGSVNVFDLFAFLAAYAEQDPVADWNNDNAWSVFDLFDYLADYNTGCP